MLKVHPLPKEMQGEAIADGPIPFIFGAKVDKMKQRYWIHDITPKEEIGQRTWLEVFPKYQHDAANFSSAVLVLNDTDFSIYGLEVTQAGGKQQSRYVFSEVIINDPLGWAKGDFAAPKTPGVGRRSSIRRPTPPSSPSRSSRAAPAATAQQPKATPLAVPAKR